MQNKTLDLKGIINFSILLFIFLSACTSPVNGNVDQIVTIDPDVDKKDDEYQWDGSLVLNGHFSEDVSGWEVPYGRLIHSSEYFYSPPGGAVAITNDTGGSLGYRSSFGQCIDLRRFLEIARAEVSEINLVIEVAVKTDPNITEAILNGIFVNDNRCGTGHVGNFERVNLESFQDYAIIKSSSPVPDEAKSLHIFITALGADETARLFIDEVRLYSSELD